MKHVLWSLKAEGNPNFWEIKGHQPVPPACLLICSSSTCWSDTGTDNITAAAEANSLICKRNGSKAAQPAPLKFVSSNRSGLWWQRVALQALQAEKWQNEEIFTGPCPHWLRQGKDESIPAGTEGFWSDGVTLCRLSQKDAAGSGGSCQQNSL